MLLPNPQTISATYLSLTEFNLILHLTCSARSMLSFSMTDCKIISDAVVKSSVMSKNVSGARRADNRGADANREFFLYENVSYIFVVYIKDNTRTGTVKG